MNINGSEISAIAIYTIDSLRMVSRHTFSARSRTETFPLDKHDKIVRTSSETLLITVILTPNTDTLTIEPTSDLHPSTDLDPACLDAGRGVVFAALPRVPLLIQVLILILISRDIYRPLASRSIFFSEYLRTLHLASTLYLGSSR
jgi:hypothetical protein